MRVASAIIFSLIVVGLSLLLPHYTWMELQHELSMAAVIVFVLLVGFMVTFSIPQEKRIRILQEKKEDGEDKKDG